MVPILVRYFENYDGIKMKVLEFFSPPNETSDTILFILKLF